MIKEFYLDVYNQVRLTPEEFYEMYSGEIGMKELKTLQEQAEEGDENFELIMGLKDCDDLQDYLLNEAGECGYLYVPEKLEDFYDSDQFNCLTENELQERIEAFGFEDDDLYRKASGNIYTYAEYLVNKYRDEAIELHNKQERPKNYHR